MNTLGLFIGSPTKEAFKEPCIKATDSPTDVRNLPAEDRRTASDLEQCTVLLGAKEGGFNLAFQSASRDERRKSGIEGKGLFVLLSNPVADQPAHFAEQRFDSAIQANQFYREPIKRAELTGLKPAHRCHATAATGNRLEILTIHDASLLYFPEQIKTQTNKNYSADAIDY
jgi:hypothetical protein